MLPTLYQFWEIFYKYKSDCVICLPRTLQWFSVSLWHKPDSLLWPLWPPQGLPRLPSPHLPPPSLSILHSAPSTLPPSGWAISSFRIFKWPFNPTEPLPSHQAQQTLILMESTKMSVFQRNLPQPPGMNSDVASSEAYVIWEKFF